jgi:hypothetical protein
VKITALLILLASALFAVDVGVYQYCGSNSMTATIMVAKESGTGHILVSATGIPDGLASVDLLASVNPKGASRWYRIDTKIPSAHVLSSSLQDALKHDTTIIFYIVDNSTQYHRARRDSAGTCITP